MALTCFIIGLLSTTSLLLAWFYTSLPMHAWHVLSTLTSPFKFKYWDKYKKQQIFTRGDWEMFLIENNSPLFADLLMCPVCLSFHVSFWKGLIIALWMGLSLEFPIAATFAYPILANLILSIYKKLNQ